MKKLIEVNNINFAYELEHAVLKEITVQIKEKEKIAVLGANGAGKSTFFLMLNGVREPDTGEIYFCGEKITKHTRNLLRRNVGIVFQEAENQIIGSSVKAEIAFGPLNMKLSREEVEERTRKAIRLMNLTELTNRPPHNLSGGEKKRVTIADILAMDAKVILFDEPTASLDAQNASIFEETLKELEAMGKTLLISTHDVDFAYRFADRILVFHNGEIIADDIPEHIFNDEALLLKANLKKPMLFELYELLIDKGIIRSKQALIPKNMKELSKLLH